MAMYDHGGGCPCGLYKECDCEIESKLPWDPQKYRDEPLAFGPKQTEVVRLRAYNPKTYRSGPMTSTHTSFKPRFIEYYMTIARETAKLSRAERLKVGCIVVKDNRTISIGYNGTPAGWDNCCEEGNKTKSEVLHAESNAIAKIAASTESSKYAAIFITHAPCIDCAKLIHQAGISEVYYEKEYQGPGDKEPKRAGLEFLEKCGISVYQHFSRGDV